MKGIFLLLLSISLLLLVQMQTGVLGSSNPNNSTASKGPSTNEAAALNSLGWGSLLLLANSFLHLFYLS
ncbi:PREDICTED: CAMPATH-1 antigen [Condylura cristata]|uniref:CAMPATH-1 antigen n=1 Tax=Condylura cristata TaxID=143302 RepID=UPI0003345E43|nr:PREDICTED: CAMPATH-1 antigen [Condylura cristata]